MDLGALPHVGILLTRIKPLSLELAAGFFTTEPQEAQLLADFQSDALELAGWEQLPLEGTERGALYTPLL